MEGGKERVVRDCNGRVPETSGCGCIGGVPCAVGTIVGVAVMGVCPVL